ncbi:MAG: 23S rRNA (guanosine(2251)-2'-O)-methyltransferase RlmB [Eubacteriaceae bacterium]|jgi:23S rRNA (guanosine2251-2'-O)-methyltransferase|nr:rRNA (guanosine2251-2-O)-methyltransferase [Eubacteriaceae bacterium]
MKKESNKGKFQKPQKQNRRFEKRDSGHETTVKDQRRFWPKDEDQDEETFIIVGKNPVLEALRSDQVIDKLLILKDNTDHVLKKIADQAKKRNIIVQSTEKARLETLADGQVHQGIVAMMAPFPYSSVEDILEKAKKKERPPFIVILDHLTDPHNLGAIIRSANLCGADGVIIPKRRSASLTATSVKASSGAVAHTMIAKVNNLSQCIESLKKKGIWVAAADMDGQAYYQADFKGALAVVIGNEGSGISRNVKKQCDFSVSIPIYGEIDSFNASAAAAIILSEAAKQRNQ